MKKTREYYNLLFDVYKSLLTDKERAYFQDYYVEDLSLKEIADNAKVSRSAVQRSIKNTVNKLEIFENKLKIYQNNQLLKAIIKQKDIKKIKKDIADIII